MSRYRTYPARDDAPQPDADSGFIGVDLRRDPKQLEPGLAAGAVNKVFSQGVAETRPGMHSVNWASELATDFDLNFRFDDYDFYGVFGADASTIANLNVRVLAGTTFQARCPSTELWHTLTIAWNGAAWAIAVDVTGSGSWSYAPEAAVGSRNYRMWMDRTFQLLCPATGLWHTVFMADVGGTTTLAVHQTGVATGDTYTAADASWLWHEGTSFSLLCPDTLVWHPFWIEMVAGAPVLAVAQEAVDEDGFDFDQDVGLGTVYGSLVFSDPFGQEGLLIAVSAGVYRILPNNEPQVIYLKDQEPVDAPVRMVQCFDRVVMFRGTDKAPLVWNPRQDFTDGLGIFDDIEQTDARNGDDDNTYGDGTEPIPAASDATLFNNRLYIPTGRDELVVSDILDYTRYSEATQRFKINAGSDDEIVRVVPFNQYTLVIFKTQSIHLLGNVYGDLSAMTNDVLSAEYGAVGRDAIVNLGKDLWFLSEGGIYSIGQALDNKLQAGNEPVSAPIQPIIERINWAHAAGVQMAYHENKVYIAVPLDGATYNNAVIVFDFLNRAWSGYWDGDYVDVHSFVKSDYAGRRELFIVTGDALSETRAAGAVFRLCSDREDRLFELTARIGDELTTRGYAMAILEDKAFGRMIVDVSSLYPSYTVEALRDGVEETDTVASVTRERTRYYVWGKAAFDVTNANRDADQPHREDYAVVMDDADTLYLGDGIHFDRLQRTQNAYRIGRRGQFVQLRIRGARGRVNIHGIMQEAAAGKRQEGTRA